MLSAERPLGVRKGKEGTLIFANRTAAYKCGADVLTSEPRDGRTAVFGRYETAVIHAGCRTSSRVHGSGNERSVLQRFSGSTFAE